MGVVQLSDDLMRVLRQQVADGRATSEAAFVEEAILRMVEEDDPPVALTPELLAAIEEGQADIAAGRYVTVTSEEEMQAFMDGIWAEVVAESGQQSEPPGQSKPAA